MYFVKKIEERKSVWIMGKLEKKSENGKMVKLKDEKGRRWVASDGD